MDPSVQILEPELEIRLVVLPRDAIHPGGGFALQRVERRLQGIDIDVVEKRGEPLLLTLPCCLSYAVQRLGHANPALRPVRALLGHVPLGPRPWLHRLRSRLPGLVRRLHSYYGGGRPPVFVHHRLRLLAFPMRAGVATPPRSNAGSPRFRCNPFVRDVAFDPGRATAPRIAVPHMLPSTVLTVSAPTMF